MNRIRSIGILLILVLTMLACSSGASVAPESPNTNLPSSAQGTPAPPQATPTQPATMPPQATPTQPAAMPSQATPIQPMLTPPQVTPTYPPSASPSLPANRTDLPPLILTPTPEAATPGKPAAIHIDSAGQIGPLGSLGTSTLGKIFDVTWRPGTQNLLVQSANHLFLLDPKSGEIFWSLPAGYNLLGFSLDGLELIALRGNELQRLNPASGQMLSALEIPLPDGLFTLSPNGRWIAATQGGDITFLDLQTHQSLILPADLNSGPIFDMSFSADGKWMIAGSQNGDLQVWDASSGQRTKFQPAAIPSPVYECQASGARDRQPSGALIISCSYPAVNNVGSTYQIGIYPASASAAGSNLVIRDTSLRGYHGFVTNAERSTLAVFAGNDIEIWNTLSGSRMRVLKDALGLSMAFNPKASNQLAVWSQRAIEIWDINTAQKVTVWRASGTTEPIVQMAFSPAPGRRQLVLARKSGMLESWDLATLQKTAEWKLESITALAFTADGTSLAVGQKSGVVTLFSPDAANFIPRAKFQAGFAVGALAFSPSDPARLYVAGESHHVHLWDVTKQVESGLLKGSNLFKLTHLDVRGSTLAAGTEAGRIVLWQNTPGSVPIAELSFADLLPILSLNVSSGGHQVIFTQGNKLKVWDIQFKKKVRETFFRNTQAILAKLAPDGCSLAVQTRNTIELLDSSTFEAYAHLESAAQLVSVLAFSSDGLLLAAGDEEGNLLLWGAAGAHQTLNEKPPASGCGSIPAP